MKSKRGRVNILNKFNQDPKQSDFLSNFQKVMLHRLILNQLGKYNKENVEYVVRSTINRVAATINTKIDGGFLLTCNVEPELYLKIQDTAKKITGNYIPMDELIHLLLTYFCHVYSDTLPKNKLPYKHVNKGSRLKKLIAFQHRFGKYYHNSVRSFQD